MSRRAGCGNPARPDLWGAGETPPRSTRPCPESNEPKWTEYGEKSAYFGFNQGQIYKKALRGEALLISPREGVVTR